MIYHTWSLVGLMLWLRYGLARGRPFTPLAEIYAKYLERPDTKAYSCDEAASLFANASNIVTHAELTHGDLLDLGAGQRHVGRLFDACPANMAALVVASLSEAIWIISFN